ncbi:MAG: UDP-2,3-diacylglucosamine diphosphatase [Flavobacteriales bacterium]
MQNFNAKRKIDILIISDVHLGTYGCHAKELLCYLRSVNPKHLILNGDIIDIWQFSKRYWPKSHMKILRHILGWISEGKQVTYITGNHDEMLRKFVGLELENFKIVNKLVLPLDNGKNAWIFHGDVFDVTMKHSKWLAKLGSSGYDILILFNRAINFISHKLGRGKISLSKKIKNSVKEAVKFINNFEQTAADLAIHNEFDFVICGHIHHPENKVIKNKQGKVTYINTGDWVENLTALEYTSALGWEMYRYNEIETDNQTEDVMESAQLDDQYVFAQLVAEFYATGKQTV